MVTMAWVPAHLAYAGMIGTDQVAPSAVQLDRAAVLGMVGRADVARQLQALGVDPAAAKERVAAMTDEEIRSLAGELHSVPAGADGSGLAILILVGVIVWLVWFRR
jgi:hypothetical protein